MAPCSGPTALRQPTTPRTHRAGGSAERGRPYCGWAGGVGGGGGGGYTTKHKDVYTEAREREQGFVEPLNVCRYTFFPPCFSTITPPAKTSAAAWLTERESTPAPPHHSVFYQPRRPCQSMAAVFQNIFNTQREQFGSGKWIAVRD